MIRNVLFGLFAFVIVGFIVVWVAGGGLRHLIGGFRTALSSTSTGASMLPWQPSNLFFRVPLPIEDVSSTEADDISGTQQDHEQISQRPSDVLTFGNPSPFYGTVKIAPTNSDPSADGPSQEYLSIEAPLSNSAPVSIAGWSLESAVSGIRVPIPDAAPIFALGFVNSVVSISLDPGASITLTSGSSPVGASFRENGCTGYLSQFQTFTPSLSLQCPQPESELPLTPTNIKTYGDACFDFIKTLPTCEFPQYGPKSLSPACQDLIQSAFSYNGCVKNHSFQGGFFKDIWRVYLNSQSELWRNSHDAIRLLDSQGQTVDVYVY